VRLSPATAELLRDPLKLPSDCAELRRAQREIGALHCQSIRLGDLADSDSHLRLLRAIARKLEVVGRRRQQREGEKGRFAEVQTILSQILAEWNYNFDEFLRATESEMERLREQQGSELSAFDLSIPGELTPKYRKRSPALLALRDRERALAQNERFGAAQRLKDRNDAREGEEARAQFRKMTVDWMRRRERMIAAHEEQMRVFVEHAESNRTRMLRTRDQLIEGHVRRMNFIDAEFEDAEVLQGELSEERRREIEEVEAGYPIPRMRGTVFASVRQRLRNRKAEGDDPGGQSGERETGDAIGVCEEPEGDDAGGEMEADPGEGESGERETGDAIGVCEEPEGDNAGGEMEANELGGQTEEMEGDDAGGQSEERENGGQTEVVGWNAE
jgi:hypothetical protein